MSIHRQTAKNGSQFGRGLSISGTATRIGVDITAGWQYGGGLYISGTATLTNTNVLSSSAPMKADCCALEAGRVVASSSLVVARRLCH
eukprot:scaffold22416_cov68-Phaeocystis_antarctica.AAC.3